MRDQLAVDIKCHMLVCWRGSQVPGNSVHTKICQRQAADQSQNGRLHGMSVWSVIWVNE